MSWSQSPPTTGTAVFITLKSIYVALARKSIATKKIFLFISNQVAVYMFFLYLFIFIFIVDLYIYLQN